MEFDIEINVSYCLTSVYLVTFYIRTVSISNLRYARKNNLPALEHVTLPRMGAVQAILDGIGPYSKQRYEEALKLAGNNSKLSKTTCA